MTGDLDDRIVTLRHDIDRARRDLEISERAEVEHRVMDRQRWLNGLAARRQTLLEMERELALLEREAA